MRAGSLLFLLLHNVLICAGRAFLVSALEARGRSTGLSRRLPSRLSFFVCFLLGGLPMGGPQDYPGASLFSLFFFRCLRFRRSVGRELIKIPGSRQGGVSHGFLLTVFFGGVSPRGRGVLFILRVFSPRGRGFSFHEGGGCWREWRYACSKPQRHLAAVS